MTVTDAPQIITSRFGYDDGAHPRALPRHRRLRGPARPRSPRRPPHVGDEVKAASLLGRGGAGFPAGVKWGFCPPGVWPRYLVVNGDESEPGTYKDRLLMEKDPHQLIEGVLIACYAVGCRQAFLYVRGEMALAQERIAAGAQRGLRGRLRRQEHPRHRLLRRHRPALGCRRLHRRRGDGAHREPRGQPRHAPPQAAVLPGRQGPVPAAHDRQQRRDALQPAVDRVSNGGAAFAALGAENSQGHAHVRGVRPREEPGRLRGRVRRHHLPRPALRAGLRRRHPRRHASSRRSSPAARRRRGSSPSTSTSRSRPARSARPARCSAPAPSS